MFTNSNLDNWVEITNTKIEDYDIHNTHDPKNTIYICKKPIYFIKRNCENFLDSIYKLDSICGNEQNTYIYYSALHSMEIGHNYYESFVQLFYITTFEKINIMILLG